MVELLGALFAIVGVVLLLAGGVWFIVAAFQESILWGLGCLFLPFVQIAFLILGWDRARRPFFLQLIGIAILVVGAMLLPSSHHY